MISPQIILWAMMGKVERYRVLRHVCINTPKPPPFYVVHVSIVCRVLVSVMASPLERSSTDDAIG
jgi:hypothetical protein